MNESPMNTAPDLEDFEARYKDEFARLIEAKAFCEIFMEHEVYDADGADAVQALQYLFEPAEFAALMSALRLLEKADDNSLSLFSFVDRFPEGPPLLSDDAREAWLVWSADLARLGGGGVLRPMRDHRNEVMGHMLKAGKWRAWKNFANGAPLAVGEYGIRIADQYRLIDEVIELVARLRCLCDWDERAVVHACGSDLNGRDKWSCAAMASMNTQLNRARKKCASLVAVVLEQAKKDA